MDKLDEIMKLQKQVDDRHQVKLLEKSLNDQLLGLSRALIHEVIEFEDELSYRWWRLPKEPDMQKLREEAADQLFFFMSIANKIFKNGDDLYTEYHKKFLKNMSRQDFEHNINKEEVRAEISSDELGKD